jgi:hypothetical protein
MDEGKVVLDGNPREVLRSEEARLIGIGIPKATLLYQLLKGKMNLGDTVPLCSEEMAMQLKEVLQRQ